MKSSLKILGTAAVLMALQMGTASANIIEFNAHLTGANESPANASTAFGDITLFLDDVAKTLFVQESFHDLTGGPATGAHIHCCGAPGVNVGVVIDFISKGFPTGPGATSGSYEHLFDLTKDLAASISIDNFIAGLKTGQAYANIHNATFKGGEIRGQLSVPEPASLALFGLGALGLGFFRRKRA